jgi:nucleoid-associated protein YgaU
VGEAGGRRAGALRHLFGVAGLVTGAEAGLDAGRVCRPAGSPAPAARTSRRGQLHGVAAGGEHFIEALEGERLDVLAGQIYNDARYWWVLAAASDIGWGMQVPPGTVIRIPDLSDIANLIG